MTKRFLINASNLHVGGGVQVASSFLSEIAKSEARRTNLSFALSSEVESAVGGAAMLSNVSDDVVSLNVNGIDPWNVEALNFFAQFDCIFTVFGPLYRWNPPFKSIVGFAQPWIIYPRNEVYRTMPFLKRLRNRLKFWIQSQFFKRADCLVVELEHVKDGLVRELGVDPARIHVVHNCLSAIYRDETQWMDVAVPPSDGKLRLGFVGRNYAHKNTKIFPEIVSKLRECHDIEALFYVTFTEEEWQASSPAFQEACVNIGPLAPAQCPAFYRALDAVVFPSLLECFSATPLETMAMERPLFASDRPFNRDVCGKHATYFDPGSPTDAAHAIAAAFKDGAPNATAMRAAREHAFSFSTPEDRAQRYLALLSSDLDETQQDI
ncbi:hypothetical protein BMI86_05775 [Thioclava sp. DLFJ5-1]|uniref:glycosyltransferase family 4 protein n=1 Tax=Thioclava sp. DLFJ5-1 TaxID=1915314 RepID=UPI0009CAC212|nr:glycosyltransferase [Thioclava sp. DLFJ5-1]OOY22034.1 hypothetical protein BMI86_05775 [Thioclava sp. DLFJ5-1]